MRTSSAAVLLVLLCGFIFSPAALAQAPVTFRGSEVRTPFGAGVLVSATRRNTGEELLRINTIARRAQAFTTRPLPGAHDPELYRFDLIVGPPLFKTSRCLWSTDNPAGLAACFAGRKAESIAPGVSFVVVNRRPSGNAEVLFRTQGVVPSYARCTMLADSRQLEPVCTMFFRQGREWHEFTTSSRAVRDMKLFQCSALELRNAVWPGAPKLPDGCRS